MNAPDTSNHPSAPRPVSFYHHKRHYRQSQLGQLQDSRRKKKRISIVGAQYKHTHAHTHIHAHTHTNDGEQEDDEAEGHADDGCDEIWIERLFRGGNSGWEQSQCIRRERKHQYENEAGMEVLLW